MPADREVREFIVETLRDSGVFFLRDRGLEIRYIGGEIDIDFDLLDMDSLASMEICIALEVTYDLSLNPDRLGRYETLNSLAAAVRDSCM